MSKTRGDETQKGMSFLDHLEELRVVLIVSIASILLLSIGAWFFSTPILDILISSVPVEGLYFHSPTEAFVVRIKVSLVVGFLIALPIILYKIWSFVSPGLFRSERRVLLPLGATSTLLFYGGVAFSYVILIPIVIRFLLSFGTDYLTPLISVSEYFIFVARLCLAFGIVFQLPLVIFILSVLGILNPRSLLKQWRWAVVICFVVSAMLTPPDLASQLLMALPMIVLLLAGILLSMLALRKKEKREDEDSGGED
jgi:sec-independent protein translocase protein TatC